MTCLCSAALKEVQRTIAKELSRASGIPGTSEGGGPVGPVLLDVGCWDGEATQRFAQALGAARMLGIEVFESVAREARRRGIEVARIDLETESFPWRDDSVDAVVCNQVLEHLKNVWLPMAEIHRVLKPGGRAVLSVPNLASLHNRVLLGLGLQPTSIRVLGPHVRAFTRREFERFIALDGALSIERSIGVGFHPLPGAWSRPLRSLWPGASHTVVVVARKTRSGPAPWRTHLERERDQGMQTFYR